MYKHFFLFKNHLKSRKNGFNLVEVFTVTIIFTILLVIAFQQFGVQMAKGRDANIKSGLNELKTALDLYYNDYQNYPTTLPVVGSTLSGPDGVVYMQEIPQYDTYTRLNNGTFFVVSVTLENASDPEICESAARCLNIPRVDSLIAECVTGDSTTYYSCSQYEQQTLLNSEPAETNENTNCTSDEDCWCRSFTGAAFIPGEKVRYSCNLETNRCGTCFYR